MGDTYSLTDKLPRYLKTRELQVFLAVAESSSIAEAARRLSLTQPAVSKSINELESTLGVTLFERDSRGIYPTRYAEVLRKRALVIFGEIKLAGEEITQLTDAGAGKISLGTMPVAAAGLAAAAVTELMLAHPGIRVSITEGDHEVLFEALRNRELDLVIGRLPADLSEDEFATQLLYHDQLCVAAHNSHRLAQREELTLEELVDERCIIPKEHSLAYQQLARTFLDKKLNLPSRRVDTLSVLSVDALLATGKYIIFGLPRKIVEHRPAAGLVILPVDLDTDWGPVGITYLKSHELLPGAKYLISCLQRQCGMDVTL